MKNIIISTEIICIIFSFIFLYSAIVEDKRKNVKKTIFCTLTVSIILALFIDSLSYIMEIYLEQKIMLHTLPILSLLISGIETTALAYYIMVHINNIKRKSLIYLLIPMAAVIVELINDKWAFSYVASAIGLGFAFVMLQSKEINESRMREEMLKKMLSLDPLTELENRRAYDTFLAELSGRGGIGAIFCDLNGLKYTNDNLGHKEGDKLICDFAELLRKYFGNQRMFRISGDEFVVLMEDLEEDEFFGTIEEFREVLLEHDQISSLGSAYGEKDCVLELISQAEEAMYADKKYYYYVRGECGRGCD